jgi:hypothetical protein
VEAVNLRLDSVFLVQEEKNPLYEELMENS